MKANELLQKQHRQIEDLFDEFEQADEGEKAEAFERIAATLVAHDAIEREIFYPACEETLGGDEEGDDVLGESLVEHGVVEFCLFRADKNLSKPDELEKYVKVLKEVVEHHVKEEESELLPKAKKAMETEKLEELGAEMQSRFEKALKSDFRRPLRENLQQVLEGRAKTTKKSPPPNGRRTSQGHRPARAPARH
jgi:hemerythrin superfamily protein